MDAKLAITIPPVDSETHLTQQPIRPATPEVPPEIQTIISAHAEYQAFSANFQELETASSADEDPKYQKSPWKDIKDQVTRDIQQTAYIVKSLNPNNTLTPEELGSQLFSVRDKFNNNHVLKGSIRAELHGPCSVTICDNEEDFKVITNHEREEGIQGSYETTHELTLGVSYQSNSVAVCPATIEAGSASIPRAYASGI